MKYTTTKETANKDFAIKFNPDDYKTNKLTVEVKEWRKSRSKNQNALLWAIIDKIAKHHEVNKTADEVYLQALKDYGVHEYLAIPENSNNMQSILKTLKYYEVQDSVMEKVKRIKVFIGSSHYDTKQATVFIDGIISDAKDLGIDVSYETKEIKSLLESVNG